MPKGLAAFLEHCDFRSLTVACRDTHERAFECNYKLVLYKRFVFSKDCGQHPHYMDIDEKVECKYCMCSTCNQELRYCGGCRRDIKPDDAACDYTVNIRGNVTTRVLHKNAHCGDLVIKKWDELRIQHPQRGPPNSG